MIQVTTFRAWKFRSVTGANQLRSHKKTTIMKYLKHFRPCLEMTPIGFTNNIVTRMLKRQNRTCISRTWRPLKPSLGIPRFSRVASGQKWYKRRSRTTMHTPAGTIVIKEPRAMPKSYKHRQTASLTSSSSERTTKTSRSKDATTISTTASTVDWTREA